MIKNNLLSIRIENHLTQKELADKLGISRITYCHYESGERVIPIERLSDFCNYFNISVDYIFGLTKNKNYKNSNKNLNKLLCAKRLRQFRKENKLSQRDIANFLNTSVSTISDYERSINIVPTIFLYALCTKYKLSADFLVGKTNSPIFY